MNKLLVVLVFVLNTVFVYGQDSSDVDVKEKVSDLEGKVEGLNESFLETKSTVDALKKIKLSGYIQAQYQNAETNGVSSFAGGNFASTVKSRFLVRRGRLKVMYDNTTSQYVLQIDVIPTGVSLKDAYLTFREPWLNSFSLTGGVFDRPFGFEISYSSGSRETPERSRLFQTLFPGERDLGVKVEFRKEDGLLSFLNLKAGLFNGTGGTSAENDNNKDFIGRAGFELPFNDANLAIDGGVSLYSGKVRSSTKYIYKTDESRKTMVLDSTSSNLGNNFDRTYIGADLQVYYDLPVIGGFSLRGEYIQGKQPGSAGANSFYNLTDARITNALYQREFFGYYLMYVQNIGDDNQFLLKYDVLDPNKDVEGTDIGVSGSSLSTGDIKFSTLGIGWIYHWDSNIKFTLYYDMVKNEKVNAASTGSLAAFTDDIKDNVLTFRIQYKF